MPRRSVATIYRRRHGRQTAWEHLHAAPRTNAPPCAAVPCLPTDLLAFLKDFRDAYVEDVLAGSIATTSAPRCTGEGKATGRGPAAGFSTREGANAMGNGAPPVFATGRIQGQLLRLNARREVAIYLRDGALWVADFVDDAGTLCEAASWFRFHCATAASWQPRRRMALESAVPLSDDLVARIEALHAGRAPGPDDRCHETGGDP